MDWAGPILIEAQIDLGWAYVLVIGLGLKSVAESPEPGPVEKQQWRSVVGKGFFFTQANKTIPIELHLRL